MSTEKIIEKLKRLEAVEAENEMLRAEIHEYHKIITTIRTILDLHDSLGSAISSLSSVERNSNGLLASRVAYKD